MKSTTRSPIFTICVAVAALFGLNNSATLSVYAYPVGAGTCGAGASIGSDSAGNHGQTGTGALSGGNLSVKLNGTLDTGSTAVYTIGADTTLELVDENSSGSGFKGFLLRLSSTDGVDVTNKLIVIDSDNSQILTSCASDVAGVTHTNRNGKVSISVIFSVDQPADLVLDVTVVKSNPPKDNWYYSQYLIKTVNPPTSSPSSVPSMIPSVTPSKEPSSTPSISSKPSISDAPSKTPVTKPPTSLKPTEVSKQSGTNNIHGAIGLISIAGAFLLL